MGLAKDGIFIFTLALAEYGILAGSAIPAPFQYALTCRLTEDMLQLLTYLMAGRADAGLPRSPSRRESLMPMSSSSHRNDTRLRPIMSQALLTFITTLKGDIASFLQ